MSDSWLSSVVLIRSSDPARKNDFGTGFPLFWDGRAMYFATCAHVVKAIGNRNNILVTYMSDGGSSGIDLMRDSRAEVYVSGETDGIDLAILRVEDSNASPFEGLRTLPILPLRTPPDEKENPFKTAGFARWEMQAFDFSILQGFFGKQRRIGINKYAAVWDLILNKDDQLRPGNSGSPVIDKDGYVVAIVSTAQSTGQRGTAISVEALKAIWSNIPPGLFLPWQIESRAHYCRVGAVIQRGEEAVVCEGWYRNTEEKKEERVALKFLPIHQSNEAFLRYFTPNVRRFQDWLSRQTNIVDIKASGILQEYAYLILEYAADGSIADFVKQGRQIPFDTALDYLLATAEALSYAHGRQITHGNVKPSNILVGNAGVLLTDFEALTRHSKGVLGGTQEQPADQRTREAGDQYALAVVACRLLTGDLSPQNGLKRLGTTHQEIAEVLRRALAANPADRYPSMRHFRTALEQARPTGGTPGQDLVVPPPPDRTSLPDNPPLIPEAKPLPPLSSFPSERREARWVPQKWLLVYAFVMTLLFLGLGIWSLALHFAAPQSLQPVYATQLGGLDLNGYCTSLTYAELVGDSSCSSPVDMNLACNWQWDGTDLHNRFSSPTNSYSGLCYDSQGKRVGGINDMEGYCKHLVHYGAPVDIADKSGTLAGWTCQQQINPTLACMWQYGTTNIEARNTQGNWYCYGPA